MNAADVMTPDVITVEADTPLEQVIALMLEHRISGVPVMQDDAVIGIISEGDLIRRVELGSAPRRSHLLEAFAGTGSLAADYARTHGRKASEVMTKDVVMVADTMPVADIAKVLESRRIKRVPVVRDGKLAGIVSRANLLRALASRLQAVPPPLASDQRIRMAVYEELMQHKWGTRIAQLDVTVNDGVVTLWGLVSSDEQRTAARVTAENVPGVRQVEDHLEDLMADGAMVSIL